MANPEFASSIQSGSTSYASRPDMVEIELGKQRCKRLDRRNGEHALLVCEIAAWQMQCHDFGIRITWKFSTDKVRNRLADAYPDTARNPNHCDEVLADPRTTLPHTLRKPERSCLLPAQKKLKIKLNRQKKFKVNLKKSQSQAENLRHHGEQPRQFGLGLAACLHEQVPEMDPRRVAGDGHVGRDLLYPGSRCETVRELCFPGR